MTPHTYSPGDLVKIISLEKVRSYPVTDDGNYEIGESIWVADMNHYAGTIQKISRVNRPYYWVDKKGFAFSPEMIEGFVDRKIIGYKLIKDFPAYTGEQIWYLCPKPTNPQHDWGRKEFSRGTYKSTDGNNYDSSSITMPESFFKEYPEFWKPLYYAHTEGPEEPQTLPEYIAEAEANFNQKDKYAERLERFVLAVAAGSMNRRYTSSADIANWTLSTAKDLLAAFDEEVKKYKP